MPLYQGTTSSYWSARIGSAANDDVAWQYDYPTCEVLPIAGAVAFYNERVDIYLDDELLDRPESVSPSSPAPESRAPGRDAAG